MLGVQENIKAKRWQQNQTHWERHGIRLSIMQLTPKWATTTGMRSLRLWSYHARWKRMTKLEPITDFLVRHYVIKKSVLTRLWFFRKRSYVGGFIGRPKKELWQKTLRSTELLGREEEGLNLTQRKKPCWNMDKILLEYATVLQGLLNAWFIYHYEELKNVRECTYIFLSGWEPSVRNH